MGSEHSTLNECTVHGHRTASPAGFLMEQEARGKSGSQTVRHSGARLLRGEEGNNITQKKGVQAEAEKMDGRIERLKELE